MPDNLTSEQRRYAMQRVKSRGTAPELYVRRALYRAGHGYRLHPTAIPGRPDIALTRYRLAVFVHGCFWHGHLCPAGKRPASNVVYWNAKITRNTERDSRVRAEIALLGWECIVIWECQLRHGTTELLSLLARKAARP